MTITELLQRNDQEQAAGEIGFAEWHTIKDALTLLREGRKDWGELETDYTEAELNCKGCMGPCGNCEPANRDIVELEEIVRLGAEMRNAQKDYFKSRESAALKLSKELERSFDQRAAKKLAENVGGTFGNTKKTPVDLFS